MPSLNGGGRPFFARMAIPTTKRAKAQKKTNPVFKRVQRRIEGKEGGKKKKVQREREGEREVGERETHLSLFPCDFIFFHPNKTKDPTKADPTLLKVTIFFFFFS